MGGLIAEGGRSLVNAAFPYDLEYYMMALELVDSNGDTVSFFVFPVMPNNYTYNSQRSTNIKETVTGINTISTRRFVPADISMQGNFGRKFKTLLSTAFNFDPARFLTSIGNAFGGFGDNADDHLTFEEGSMKQNYHNLTSKSMMSVKFKTGYGTVKVMETICDMSDDLDRYKKPHRLYLHNPARGDNYLVKVINFKSMQTTSSNLIWDYSLQLKAVAPLG